MSNKLHWHIRFDTRLGNIIHKVFRGRLDSRVINWYENKYPTYTRKPTVRLAEIMRAVDTTDYILGTFTEDGDFVPNNQKENNMNISPESKKEMGWIDAEDPHTFIVWNEDDICNKCGHPFDHIIHNGTKENTMEDRIADTLDGWGEVLFCRARTNDGDVLVSDSEANELSRVLVTAAALLHTKEEDPMHTEDYYNGDEEEVAPVYSIDECDWCNTVKLSRKFFDGYGEWQLSQCDDCRDNWQPPVVKDYIPSPAVFPTMGHVCYWDLKEAVDSLDVPVTAVWMGLCEAQITVCEPF